MAVPAGRVVDGADDAVALAAELGGPVAVKASSPALQHKSDAGALALGVLGPDAVRAAHARVAAAAPGADVLVEAMAAPGVELVVAARRDAVVPALVVGLGGVWTELLDDVAIVPLPASAGAGRGGAALAARRGPADRRAGSAAVDLGAVAALAAACGDLLLREGLALLELNPVIASPRAPSRSTRSRGADRRSGLRGLTDRLGALRGRLELESPPGRGTTLRALVPLG